MKHQDREKQRQNRESLEDHWRQRVEFAKQLMEKARLRVKAIEDAVKAGHFPGASGHREEELAMKEFIRTATEFEKILQLFTDLILEGIVPAE